MPRGGELSSFKVPGVGNLLHSCKKNTNPGGIARGGMVTAGIDPCITCSLNFSLLSISTPNNLIQSLDSILIPFVSTSMLSPFFPNVIIRYLPKLPSKRFSLYQSEAKTALSFSFNRTFSKLIPL